MPEAIRDNKAVMTRRFLKNFINCVHAAGSGMREDDLMEISILNNTIIIETDGVSTIIKLDKQD